MLKDDTLTSALDSHFNFLQAVHEEDPLLADSPVDIGKVHNGHLKGYAGRFTDAVIQRSGSISNMALNLFSHQPNTSVYTTVDDASTYKS